MKAAAIGDAWRRVRKSKSRHIRSISVTWTEVPRLSDGDFVVTKPITLICGENGAGKSSLLHLIYQAASSDEVVALDAYCRPHSGIVSELRMEVSGSENGEELVGVQQVREALEGDSDGSLLVMVDPGMHIPALLTYFRVQKEFSGLLEGLTPREFSPEELKYAGFIVGRSYESISVWEVEDSSFGPVFPFFKVKALGVEYTSPGMGYGELSILYLVWLLSRVLTGSLVLLEEPEAFLSPRAQVCLVDVIADVVGKKDLMLVMTSHSGAIATRLETHEIAYMSRSGSGVEIHTPPRLNDLIERLGLMPDKQVVLFVEDVVGEIFARTLINKFSARFGGRGEYVVKKGESEVLRAMEVLPASLRLVAHVGILDGDQRAKLDPAEKRVVCLPGDACPEIVLIDFLKSLDPTEAASLCGSDAQDFGRAIAHADGLDVHDWPHTVSKNLGLSHSELIRRMAVAWAASNQGAAVGFVSEVEAAIIGRS